MTMPGRQVPSKHFAHNTTQDDYLDAEVSAQASCRSVSNHLDQAFILYSDEDISHSSYHSFDSQSVALSRHSHRSECSHKLNAQSLSGNLLDQFANEESSIHDVRQSECSESCKELIHTLEPLFNSKSFLRRSPRFATHNQPLQCEAIQIIERSFRVKKGLTNPQALNTEMIEDEKSPLNQNNQILQQKEEQSMLQGNATANANCMPSFQKLIEAEQPLQPQIFPSVRQTRSSKKISCESESTLSSSRGESTSEYLSKATKEFIMAVKKEKKIKKRLKEKSFVQKVRQYSLRNH